MDYPTVEQLIDEAPDVISRSTLKKLKTVFELAKYRAKTCSLGKMADNLLFVGQGIDDIVDEMAYAFQKGRIESSDYDAYIKKIEGFQWGTVTKTMEDILLEKCKCGAKEGNPYPPKLSVPEKHQLKIAKDTLKMSDAMARVMGGMTKEEAREVIKKLEGKNDGRHL